MPLSSFKSPGALYMEAKFKPKPPTSIPGQYSRVSDVYGVGAVDCWILVAYSVAIQFTFKSPLLDTVTAELAATLLYPIIIAGHLILQVSKYPGPRGSIWTTDDEKLIQYAAAIQAACWICIIAFGINLTLGITTLQVAHPTRPKRRPALFGFVNVWIFAALCYSAFKEGFSRFLSGSLCVLAVAVFFAFFPVLMCIIGFSLSIPFVHIISAIRTCFHGSISDLWQKLMMAVFSQIYIAFSLLIGYFFVTGFHGLFMPISNHNITDLGQALAVLGAGVNVVFSIYDAIKASRRTVGGLASGLWDFILGDYDQRLPMVR